MSDIKYSKIENADGKYFTFPFGINDYSDLFVFVNGKYTDAYIFASSLNNKDETIIYTNHQVKGTIEAFKLSDAEKSMLLDDNKLGKDAQVNHLEYIYDLLKERTINVPQIIKDPIRDELDDLKIYLKHRRNLIIKNLPDQFTYKWLQCNGQLIETGIHPQLIPYLPITDSGKFLKIPDLRSLERPMDNIIPVFKLVTFEQEPEDYEEEEEDPLPELPPDDPYVPPPSYPPILPEHSGKVLDINTIDLYPNGNFEVNDIDENGKPIYDYSEKQIKVSDIEYKIIETSDKELYLLTFKVDSRTINNDVTHNYINKDILLIYKYNKGRERFEFEREVDLAFKIKQNFPRFTFNFNFYYFEFYGPSGWESSYTPYYGSENPLNQSRLYSIKHNSGKPNTPQSIRNISIQSFSMNDIFFDKITNKIIIPSIPSRFISNNNIVSLLPSFYFDLTDTSSSKADYINSNLDTELYNLIKNRTNENLWLTYTNYTEQTFVNSFNFAIMDKFKTGATTFIIRGYLSGIGHSANLNNKSTLVNLKLNITNGELSLISEYNSYVGYEEDNKLKKGIFVRSPVSSEVDRLTSTEINENDLIYQAYFDFCAFKPILGGVFEDNNSNTYYLAKTLNANLEVPYYIYSGISPYLNHYGDLQLGYREDFLKFLDDDFNKTYTYKKHHWIYNTISYHIPWVFEVEYDIYTGNKLSENKKVIMLENINEGTFNVVYYESQSTSPIYEFISQDYYFTNDNKIVFNKYIEHNNYKKLVVDDIEQINTTYKILDISNFYNTYNYKDINNFYSRRFSRLINDKYIYSYYINPRDGSQKAHTLHSINSNNLVLSDSDGELISELDLLDYIENLPSGALGLGKRVGAFDKYQRSIYIRDLDQSDGYSKKYDPNFFQLFFSFNLKNYEDYEGFDSDGNIELHIDRKLLLKYTVN